jgi:hypothetical protein
LPGYCQKGPPFPAIPLIADRLSADITEVSPDIDDTGFVGKIPLAFCCIHNYDFFLPPAVTAGE